VSRSRPSSRNLAAAVERELRKLKKVTAKSGHPGGVSLDELLERVNTLSEQLLPEEESRDSRVSRVFTPRSFRHYQTLGCIDVPERDGKRTVYGSRHFVQALLVRKLLWERASAERIAGVVAGRSTEETKRMLFEGVETVARNGAEERDHGPDAVGLWKCVRVSPGVELHMSCDLPKPKPAALRKLLVDLEAALRRNL